MQLVTDQLNIDISDQALIWGISIKVPGELEDLFSAVSKMIKRAKK